MACSMESEVRAEKFEWALFVDGEFVRGKPVRFKIKFNIESHEPEDVFEDRPSIWL